MFMEKIYSAKTLDAAKEMAFAEFSAQGIDADSIDFEILEQPVKKLFGMKGEFKIKAIAAEPAQAAAPAAAEAPAEEASAPIAAEASEKISVDSEKVKTAIAYLTKVLTALGVENFSINPIDKGDIIVLDIVGDKLGIVIGRRGETLDSLQYLAILAGNRSDEQQYCRISVDCNGYREKRKETLEALAKRTAQRVLKQGRRVTLEPMNPYERRIIHSTVAEIEGVSSHSTGEEPYRKVVISSINKPSYEDRGDRRDGGRRGGRRGAPNAGRSYKQSTGFSTSFEREYKRSRQVEYSQETVDLEKDDSIVFGKIEL